MSILVDEIRLRALAQGKMLEAVAREANIPTPRWLLIVADAALPSPAELDSIAQALDTVAMQLATSSSDRHDQRVDPRIQRQRRLAWELDRAIAPDELSFAETQQLAWLILELLQCLPDRRAVLLATMEKLLTQ